MSKKPFIVLIFMSALCGLHVTAAYALDQATLPYVDAQLLPPSLLPPPPVEGTPDEQRQIVSVLQAQRRLSAGDITAIKNEQKMRLSLMTSEMAATFTRQNYPKTFMMLDRVLTSSSNVVEADKKFYHTRRPYLVDTNVKLYVDRIDDSPAYPSGHTAETRVLAEVMGMLNPDRLPALRARADAIAQDRVRAGVHFPNDLDGGRLLAMVIVGSLVANDDFQDDLTIARREMAGK